MGLWGGVWGDFSAQSPRACVGTPGARRGDKPAWAWEPIFIILVRWDKIYVCSEIVAMIKIRGGLSEGRGIDLSVITAEMGRSSRGGRKEGGCWRGRVSNSGAG